VKSDELIREVDEELQRDKLLALWNRYGALILALAVAVVLASAGWLGWQQWRERALTEQALTFERAKSLAASGAHEQAAQAYAEIAGSGSGGFASLAGLRRAEALLLAGDRGAAIDVLEGLAASSSSDPLLRRLASLQSLALQIDAGDPALLMPRLEALAAENDPWQPWARELLAIVKTRTGAHQEARDLLDAVANDPTVPRNMQQRAAELRGSIAGAGS
jgi:hypothetical protein